jgi:glycosyltransferase involved in cell wall biosynthesis
MLGRWKKKWITNLEFNGLIESALKILSSSNTIVFSPNNTGANWLGIKNATIGMFPNNYLVLPQSYSNLLLSPKQQNELTNTIKKNGGEQIIFSGIPSYTLNWIKQFNQLEIKTGVIYHGGLAELAGSESRQFQMEEIIQLANQGIINRIGVVKEGLDSWFKNKTSTKVFRVIPTLKIPDNLNIIKFDDGKTHIGVFGNSSYNKNRHSQVVAASMIENSVIHIIEPNEFNYTIDSNKIITHKNLNRNEFLSLLGSMDINLYCSYSESWGQVVLESIALGIPCITTANSGILNWDNELSNHLIVKEYDNINAIKNQIKVVLNNHSHISILGKNYITIVNHTANQKINALLS